MYFGNIYDVAPDRSSVFDQSVELGFPLDKSNERIHLARLFWADNQCQQLISLSAYCKSESNKTDSFVFLAALLPEKREKGKKGEARNESNIFQMVPFVLWDFHRYVLLFILQVGEIKINLT